MNRAGYICSVCCLIALTAGGAARADDAYAAYQRQDYATAYQGFQQLAEQGDLNAMNNLGLMFMNGLGVKKDDAAAANWFKKAADKGHLLAMTNLGTLYEMGQGVAQNYDQAAKLYRVAADHGIREAQYNIAALYEAGHGVPKDDMQAYIWYGLAAKAGDKEAAAENNKLASTLDSNLKGPADAYIKSWKPLQN